MEAWAWPIAALAGALVGLVAAGEQWRAYSEPAFREERLQGRRLLVTRALVGLACAAACAVAFRPDYYDFGPALATAAFAVALVVLSSTDFERRRLPNSIIYPAIIAAAALCWAWPDRSISEVWIGFGVAAGAAAGMYALGALLGGARGTSDTPFGMGDVKLIGLEGLLLGWPAIVGALFVGVLLAWIPSLIMIVSGRGRRTFSYGPYLAAGCLVILLFFDRFG
ncbi:MAG: prepilin peptidase [Dehalococcoidia bacterium]